MGIYTNSRYHLQKGLQELHNVAMKKIKASERLSLTQCKNRLNKKGINYTDEQILAIRDWLYLIGEIIAEEIETGKNQ